MKKSIPAFLKIQSYFWTLLYVLSLPLKLFLGSTKFYDFVQYGILRCNGYSERVARFVIAQARLETGNYVQGVTSMKNGSLYGMKEPQKRNHFGNGTFELSEGTFLSYLTVVQSIFERMNWDFNAGFGGWDSRKNEDAYLKVLENYNVPDSDYIAKIETIEPEIGSFMTSYLLLAVYIVVGLVGIKALSRSAKFRF